MRKTSGIKEEAEKVTEQTEGTERRKFGIEGL